MPPSLRDRDRIARRQRTQYCCERRLSSAVLGVNERKAREWDICGGVDRIELTDVSN
jgi:hypothetical protein